ncbi:MFS transporter [Thalassobacillus devorans]|uniref:MFS transporter n=1 Tax=Thalassobacillus devorans TaxID=279813 RepID=UPI00048DCBE1|nr:MFS transporter [Thalassobacillus devorans]
MYKTIWKNKDIRFYLLAGGISRLGDTLSGMAFLFLAYDLTGSSLHTTGMAMAETIPYLLFGLIGGVMADWLPKKKWLIYLDIARIPLISSIVLLYYFDMLTYIYLLIVSFFIQSIGCFFNPAHRSILPAITGERERTAANSMNDTLTRGVTVLSPVLSVWLLNCFGVVHFFTVDAITYAISALFIYQVDLKEPKNTATKSFKAVFVAIAEFAEWVKAHRTIRKLFLFTFITVFFNTWVWQVGMLLALTEMSSQSEELYSMLQGVFGGVVIITNLLLPYFIKKMTLRHYLIGALIWGAGVLYYGLLYDMPHFFIGAALVGVGLPIAGLARVYLLQTFVPEEKLGRAFSSNAVLLYFSNTVSLGLYGLLVLIIPIKVLMISSGLFIIISSTGALLFKAIKTSKFTRRFTVHFLK